MPFTKTADQVWLDGQNVEKSDVRLWGAEVEASTSSSAGNLRDAAAADSLASSLTDGQVGFIGGVAYVKDSTAIGTLSATNDLGVDGLSYFGPRYWSDPYVEDIKYGVGQTEAWIMGAGAGDGVTFGSASAKGVFAWGAGVLKESNGVTDGIFIGGGVASHGDPGRHNIAIGAAAGARLNKDGGGLGATRNTLLGSLSGHFMTTAERNTATGRNTMHGLETGQRNTTDGYASLSVGENPVVNGRIEHQGPIFNCSFNTNIGEGGLSWADSNYNVSIGYNGLEHVKGGDGENTAAGAETYRALDYDLSPDGYVLDRTGHSVTCTQAGTTVTVTGTGINAVAGRYVKILQANMNLSTSYVWVQVVSAPDANTFTYNAITNQTLTEPGTIDWVETGVSRTFSKRNTGLGYRAGFELESGFDNVHIGPAAGNHMGTSYDNMLVIDNGFNGPSTEAAIVTDLTTNRTGLGGNVSLVGAQAEKVAIYENGTKIFGFGTDGTSTHGTETKVAAHTFYGSTAEGVDAAIGVIDENGNQGTIGLTDVGNLHLKAEDGEVVAVDSAGNNTTLSPHNFSLIPDGASEDMAWSYYSERDGQAVNVDMMKMARLIEGLTGEKLVHLKSDV